MSTANEPMASVPQSALQRLKDEVAALRTIAKQVEKMGTSCHSRRLKSGDWLFDDQMIDPGPTLEAWQDWHQEFSDER